MSSDTYPVDVVPTQAGVDQAIAAGAPLITMIRGRLALVYFAESSLPTSTVLREAIRKLRKLHDAAFRGDL